MPGPADEEGPAHPCRCWLGGLAFTSVFLVKSGMRLVVFGPGIGEGGLAAEGVWIFLGDTGEARILINKKRAYDGCAKQFGGELGCR